MKLFYLFFILLLGNSVYAQTWNGSVSSNWNTAGNWTPNTVPTLSSDVNIASVSGSNHTPQLTSNISVNTLTMSPGSILDINGFTVTTFNCDFNGASLNNTNPVTDIILTVNGNGVTYFRNNVINDNITINYNGTSEFYEAYQGGNIYNGNTIFNAASTGTLSICYSNRSTFNGNLTVNRTVAGITEILRDGGIAINGNFSYTNNVGGSSTINQAAQFLIPITGTVNITASASAGNPTFTMYKIKNQIGGGTISIQNSGSITMDSDTLQLNALNLTGYVTGSVNDIVRNVINGSVTIADGAANTGSLYFRSNNYWQ